jgi:hypothetical protein
MAMTNWPAPAIWSARGVQTTSASATLNANGEDAFAVGQLVLANGATGSKTLSAAGGGAIFWNTAAAVTFADAGTDVRLGVQDVNASGLNDGTFDVSATLIGGTDTIASQALHSTPMEAGSKTMTAGSLYAVGATMVTRGGSDALVIDFVTNATQPYGLPYGIANAAKSSNAVPCFTIRFDDGTYGWLLNAALLRNFDAGFSSLNVNSGSTPDEYAGVVTVPSPLRVMGFGFSLANLSTSTPFEFIAYADPLGTPVAQAVWPAAASALLFDPDQVMSDVVVGMFATPWDLVPATAYGFAVRPTSGSNITFRYVDLASGFDVLKVAQPFSTIKLAARTNQAGSFTETQVYHLPDLHLVVAGSEDGTGGGGGGGDVVGARIFTGY